MKGKSKELKELRCGSCCKLLLKTKTENYELETKCPRCGALNEFKKNYKTVSLKKEIESL